MRTKKAFIPCSVAVAGALLTATTAMAADPLPTSCTTTGGGWTVTVLAGPCPVSNIASPACAASGGFTGIKYRVMGDADHIGTLVTKNNTVAVPSGTQVSSPCAGDGLTGIGKFSCHEKAIKINPSALKTEFWVVVTGQKFEVLQSVVAKKGTRTEACAITGLGLETVQVASSCVSSCGNFHPKQTILKDEVFRFKTGGGIQCFAKFERDLATGEVITFSADPRSDPACDFLENDVSALQLLLNGVAVGASTSDPNGTGQFGDGFLSTGSDSCTTRVVNGKVYTWGSPCPQ